MEPISLSRRSFVAMAAGAGAALASAGVLATAVRPEAAQAAGGKEVKIAESGDEGFVIDAKGNEVAVPEKLERVAITCNGGTTHEAIIFGGADKIVAEPSMEAFPQLLRMFPQLNDVVNGGSFDDVNVETIAATEPDIALCGVSSDKGNAQIEEIGIPVYVMLIGWAAVDTIKQEFLNASATRSAPRSSLTGGTRSLGRSRSAWRGSPRRSWPRRSITSARPTSPRATPATGAAHGSTRSAPRLPSPRRI